MTVARGAALVNPLLCAETQLYSVGFVGTEHVHYVERKMVDYCSRWRVSVEALCGAKPESGARWSDRRVGTSTRVCSSCVAAASRMPCIVVPRR